MTDSLKKAAEAIATEMVALAQVLLDAEAISDSNARNYIRAEIAEKDGGVVIGILFDNYIEYIENIRSPMRDKRPSMEALREWAVTKGIPTDNATLHAIDEAIWRDGILPRPILATLSERIDQQFESKWADMLFDALTDELIKYFNA